MILAPTNENQYAESEAQVVGAVVLHKPIAETGPFRADVLKLFISPDHRRKGLAKKLMVKLEEVARREGRTLLACPPSTV